MVTTYLYDFETTSLSPFDGEICILSYIKMGDTVVYIVRGPERKIIEHFINTFTPRNTGLISFNGLKFDIPFLRERMEIQGYDLKYVWYVLRSFYDADMRQYHVVDIGFQHRGVSLKGMSKMQLKPYSELDSNDRNDVNRYCYFQMIALASLVNKHVRKNQTVTLPLTLVKEFKEIDL